MSKWHDKKEKEMKVWCEENKDNPDVLQWVEKNPPGKKWIENLLFLVPLTILTLFLFITTGNPLWLLVWLVLAFGRRTIIILMERESKGSGELG